MDYTDGSVDDGEMVRKMSTLKGEKIRIIVTNLKYNMIPENFKTHIVYDCNKFRPVV